MSPGSPGTGRGGALLALVLAVTRMIHAGVRMAPPLDGVFRHEFLGHNASRYALAGRNYVRHGFLDHALLPDLRPGAAAADAPRVYVHHPPLAPLVVGASFAVWRESERAAVLPFLVAGVLSVFLMFLLGRRLLGGVGGGAAALLFGVAPMTGFYGAHVDPQGPLVTAALLAFVLAMLAWRDSGRRRALAAALGFLVLGLLSDWSLAYAALFVPLFLRRPDGGALPARFAPLLVCVAFAFLFVAWIAAAGLSPVDDLLDAAAFRVQAGLGGGLGLESGAVWAALERQVSRQLDLFPPLLLLLAAVGLVRTARRAAARPGAPFDRVLAMLLATGALHVVLFPQGALIHDYWTYLLAPALALAGGAAVEAARRFAAALGGDGFGVLAVLAACGATAFLADRTTQRLYAERSQPVYAELGLAVREQVRDHQRVATNSDLFNPLRVHLLTLPELTYYSDRAVRGAIRTRADLERAEAEDGPFDVYLHVPFTGVPEPPLVAELRLQAAAWRLPFQGLVLEYFLLRD